MRRTTSALTAAALVAFAACGSTSDDDARRSVALQPRAPSLPAPAARLPPTPGDLLPAMGRVTEREVHPGAATLGARLADVALCEGCHEDVADGFRASAHGHASFDNPLYRVAVERLARERGTAATRVCGGCHDIALLVDGALDAPIEASDRRAHAGISCRSCHGFSAVDVVGNGAWTSTRATFHCRVRATRRVCAPTRSGPRRRSCDR
ncbi:MAG: hypothetical protein IPG50_35955 [Myxococcales bacterium]|nr:hypothetical protein [Myxococcales bacterium]